MHTSYLYSGERALYTDDERKRARTALAHLKLAIICRSTWQKNTWLIGRQVASSPSERCSMQIFLSIAKIGWIFAQMSLDKVTINV